MFRFKEEYLINSNNKSLGRIIIYGMNNKEKDFDSLDKDTYIPKRLYRNKLNLSIKKGLKR